MKELKIKSSIKLHQIEELYVILEGQSKELIDLRLPKTIKNYFFGLAPSIIQFAATWMRSDKCGKLIIDLNIGDEEAASKYYSQEFFFPIVSLAWNDIKIENLSRENLRPFLRSFQNNFLLKMRKSEAMKGEKLLLVNLDHFDYENGILKIFEQNREFSTTEKDLKGVLKEPVFNGVIKYGKSKVQIEKSFDDIIGIIFELMKNTFEWGRTNEVGRSWNPNIRGLYIRAYKKFQHFLEENESDRILRNYFSSKSLETNDFDQLHFIEISVFDTGSGFIKKFNNKTNIKDDFSILKSCLIKHQTSSIGNLENDKGIGLDRILKLLDDKGFLRIRTDKYCVYRNMITHRYRLSENFNPDIMQIFDWGNSSEKMLTKYSTCSGSLISILVPITTTNMNEDE